MDTLASPSETQKTCLSAKQSSRTIGLVPTMGYLHEGHLALVRRARAENDLVVVSIFVNPTQFGPAEDLERYPRDLVRDLALLTEENVDVVFTPDVSGMYPEQPATFVEVPGVSEVLCGASRPGHFRGVASVVTKLFNIVQPDRSYFGQKDYQQTIVIRKMVRDLNIPVQIIICPTVRESDGLAMSSRNSLLGPHDRVKASQLILALKKGEAALLNGERDPLRVAGAIRGLLAETREIFVDYIEVVDAEDLKKKSGISDKDRVLLALAVRIGGVRLIDNLVVNVSS